MIRFGLTNKELNKHMQSILLKSVSIGLLTTASLLLTVAFIVHIFS